MMVKNLQWQFTASVWKYNSTKAWYFVSLPIEISKEIRENLKWQEEGWGRLKTTAEIRNNSWKTALWFDTKQNTYLLAIKSAIRKMENIEAGSELIISIRL
jgi:hypothetical protein